MKNIVKRIEGIVAKSQNFGYAVANLASDMGVDIGLQGSVPIDIVNVLPSVENIALVQFRLAIITVIVRSFDKSLNDKGRVHYFNAMFEKFNQQQMLTVADMQSYQTMMFLLHPKKNKNTPSL